MAKQSRIAHLTDSELNNATAKEIGDKYYAGNIGAGWNAINTLKKQRSNGSEPAKLADMTVKTVSARLTPSIAAKAPESAKLAALPVRVEEWMLNHCLPDEYGDNDGKLIKHIPQHFVELVVLSDDPKWNKRIRGLGPDEIDMLEGFIGKPCTMNRRENAMLLEHAQAPFKASQARIDAQAVIDAQIESANFRFEAMRYDAAIVAAYA